MSDKKVQHSYYPHLVVGNIAKVSTEIIQKFLVKYDVEPASTLIEELTQASEENESLTAFESIAQGYLDNNADAIHEKSDLLDLFPAFDVAIEILSKNDPDEIPDIEPDNPLFDLIEHESIFWDNTIAHFIIHKINPLTNDLVLVTKFIGILKKIQVTTLASKPEPIKKEELLEYWNKSRVILPKPIFPLPKKATNEPTPPPPVPDTHYEELLEELNLYQSAKEEILSTYEFQTQQLKKAKMSADEYKTSLKNAIETEFLGRNNISPKNIDEELNLAYERYINEPFAEELTVAYYETLSLPTKTVFSNLGIQGNNINVLFAVKKIDAKITSISKELALYAKREKVVLIGNTLISINNAIQEDVICRPKEEAVSHCRLLHQLMADNPEKSYIQILGTGYANVIRQELVRYEADEIAHIENVLAGEKREKTHRNKKTQEDFSSTTTETNQETETNTRTSDRFELSKEVNKITEQSTQFNAGVSLSASYGPVSLTANVGYASANSSSEVANTATNNAKEITESATQRIQERNLEIRSVTTINEVELTNQHTIDNTGNTEHINGFYYWVDKVYSNQVYNVGKRLMLEFMIPEPAAYHIYSNAFSKREGVTVEKPIDPKTYIGGAITSSLKSHKDINSSNYHVWGALYGAMDLQPFPQEFTTISKAYSLDVVPGSKEWFDKDFNDLVIPEGYQADTAFLNLAFSSGSGRYIAGHLGRKYFSKNATSQLTLTLDGETDIIPFSFRGNFKEYAINVEILCKLSLVGYEKWQMAIYTSIINAYNQQKAEYDSQVSNMEMGITIAGQNPIQNRITEQTELKKWGIEILTLQRFDDFKAMVRSIEGVPEINFKDAYNEGRFVKFFEQAIEWNNMTYLFYPYFWGRKERWSIIKNLNDTDSVFTQFLQAGYARVVVPVHPKFTEAILHYLNTGEIWMGEDLPAIDDDLYIHIVEEIKTAETSTEDEPIGDSWETRIPTNMVMVTDEIPKDLPGSN